MAAIERHLKVSTNEDLYESFQILDENGDPRELVSGWFTAKTQAGVELVQVEAVQDVAMWITVFVPQATMETIVIPAGDLAIHGRYDIVFEFTGPRRARVQRGPITVEAGVTEWP
jgi:hypothetical protein